MATVGHISSPPSAPPVDHNPSPRSAPPRGRTQQVSTLAPGSLSSADVRAACTAPSTKKAYKSYINGISKWIKAKLPYPDTYFDGDGGINVEVFKPSHFEMFLLEKMNAKALKVSTLGGYRSAVWDIYRQKKISLPQEYTTSLKTFFRGLKRIEADNDQNGTGRPSGKCPLSFSLYKDLCQKTIGALDNGFSHLYLILQWNLMCRSKSIETVHVAHLNCVDDSVGCVLHKTKTNQEGTGPKDPRHIYGNPLNPNMCCLLAFGIYFASNPTLGYGMLFPGSNEKSRFSKKLGALLEKQTGDKAYGTHSIRKSVATFASSGSTAGPSLASVCLRCGWSIGGVQDRYMRYEAAGDQFLGRVVAGLPLKSPDFAVLPPHFVDSSDCAIHAALQVIFPSMSKNTHMHPILSLCLASLVHHEMFLRQQLPTTHPLLSSVIFRDRVLMDPLRCKLVRDNNSPMVPTGIPPYIYLYRQQQETHQAIERMPDVLLTGISNLLDAKGIGAGAMGKEELESTIRNLLNEAGLYQRSSVQCEPQLEACSGTIIYWQRDGKFHRLPESFEFPDVDALGVWHLWWFGNPTMGYPPFKGLQPSDFSTTVKRKRYSEWTVLVKHLSDAVKAATNHGLRPPQNQQEADNLFGIAIKNVPMKPSAEVENLTGLIVQLRHFAESVKLFTKQTLTPVHCRSAVEREEQLINSTTNLVILSNQN